MKEYIKREDITERLEDVIKHGIQDKYGRHLVSAEAVLIAINGLDTADVVEVHTVIDRMNEERKIAKGNWHTDPYWLGWVDAMSRAQRIVDGTIDDEPMYAPSIARKENKK